MNVRASGQPPSQLASPRDFRLSLRLNEACIALGIGRSSLYELINAGQIKTSLVAGRRVIPVSELERVLIDGMSNAA